MYLKTYDLNIFSIIDEVMFCVVFKYMVFLENNVKYII